jgi:hypothetical protein
VSDEEPKRQQGRWQRGRREVEGRRKGEAGTYLELTTVEPEATPTLFTNSKVVFNTNHKSFKVSAVGR